MVLQYPALLPLHLLFLMSGMPFPQPFLVGAGFLSSSKVSSSKKTFHATQLKQRFLPLVTLIFSMAPLK